jgi:hypothetical protein
MKKASTHETSKSMFRYREAENVNSFIIDIFSIFIGIALTIGAFLLNLCA